MCGKHWACNRSKENSPSEEGLHRRERKMIMEIDYKKLEEGLKNLTGLDFEDLEKQARMMGDTSPEITLSKKLQALMAAKALGVKYEEIQELPMKQYITVTLTVFNFFFGDMAETMIPSIPTAK